MLPSYRFRSAGLGFFKVCKRSVATGVAVYVPEIIGTLQCAGKKFTVAETWILFVSSKHNLKQQ